MTCANCGTSLREGSPFCSSCGAKQPAASPPAAGGTLIFDPNNPPPSPAGQGPTPAYGTPPYQAPSSGGYPGQGQGQSQGQGQGQAPPYAQQGGYAQPSAPPPPYAAGGYGGQPQAQPSPYGQQSGYPQQQYPQPGPYGGQPQYPQPGYAGAPYLRPSAGARPGQAVMIAAGIMALAGLLMIVSPFLPWAQVSILRESESTSYRDYISDTDKNAVLWLIPIAAGIAAAAGGGLRYLGTINAGLFRLWAAAVGAGGLVAAIIQYAQFADEKSKIDDARRGANTAVNFSISLTWGFYLLVLGMLLAFGALFFARPGRGEKWFGR